MNLSVKQMDTVLEVVSGYVNGCNPVAMRSAASMAVRDYVRDAGGVVIPAVFDRGTLCGDVVHIDAPFHGVVTGVVSVSVEGNMQNPQSYRVVMDEDGCADVFMGASVDGSAVCVRYGWEPTVYTEEMPSGWFRANASAICDAVVAKLLTQTGKPWADEMVGAQFMARYQEDVRDALYRLHASRMEGGRMDMRDRNEPFVPGL